MVPGLRKGENGGLVRLKTNYQGKTIDVPVIAEFVPPYSIKPKILSLGIIGRAEGKTKKILIENQSGQPLALEGVYFDELSQNDLYVKVAPKTRKIKETLTDAVPILPNAIAGRLNGKIILLLKGPNQTRKAICISGHIEK